MSDAEKTTTKDMAKLKLAPLSYKDCIAQIKQVFETCTDEMDSTCKYNRITQIFRKYYEDEDVRDVFEGFLRSLIELDKYASSVADVKNNALAVQSMQVFDDYTSQLDPFDQDIIAESMPENGAIFAKALKVASTFKQKHLEKTAKIFRLHEPDRKEKLLKLIKHFLSKSDVVKAAEWISYFNLRDHFNFDEIVCHLFLTNQLTLMEQFVGDTFYRKRQLIAYFDKLIELDMKKFKGRNEAEEYMLADIKKVEKSATKYMKLYNIKDSEAPFVLRMRSRSALLFHHYRWQQKETTFTSFVDTAMHALVEDEYIRNFYLDFLCNKGLHRFAIYFALLLKLTHENFTRRLASYIAENPEVLDEVRKEVDADLKRRKELHDAEGRVDCQLFEGYPIFIVEDWPVLRKVMKALEDEELIGIDTEWKPHFVSTKEQVALIQVACSKAVFLIDVVVLESRLSNENWLEFFKVLLCSENSRKVGFDFRNDLRVLKSTFPFLSHIVASVKHVICLYKLLAQVLLIPEAAQHVFGVSNAKVNLSLYDIAKTFLDVEMDKSERIGNWVQRPMRLEQKKYAALDAYCLTECFRLISERLLRLPEPTIVELQKVALVNFRDDAEPTRKTRDRDPETGEYCVKTTKCKENDDEFLEYIFNVSKEIEEKSVPGTRFRSVNDFRFVMDSMLFGLGKKLRKCGFETEFIPDREKLLKFCKTHSDYTVISAGKAYRQLQLYLPMEQVIGVPINTNDAHMNSQLVGFIMRELKILIRAENIRSRCVNCNQRAFERIHPLIVKAVYYLNAVQKNMDFLEISDADLQRVLEEMHSNAVTDLSALRREDDYVVEVCDGQITCRSQGVSIDVMNRLVLASDNSSPTEIRSLMSVNPEFLEQPNVTFYICTYCGKIQWSVTAAAMSPNAKEEAERKADDQ